MKCIYKCNLKICLILRATYNNQLELPLKFSSTVGVIFDDFSVVVVKKVLSVEEIIVIALLWSRLVMVFGSDGELAVIFSV